MCPSSPGRSNHWSAIIGASHSKNYVLWEYGGYASDGVKQVAELGSPVKMEEEIRQKVRPPPNTRTGAVRLCSHQIRCCDTAFPLDFK